MTNFAVETETKQEFQELASSQLPSHTHTHSQSSKENSQCEPLPVHVSTTFNFGWEKTLLSYSSRHTNTLTHYWHTEKCG